jgi:hypothetical protein
MSATRKALALAAIAFFLACAGCATRGPVDDQRVVDQLGFVRPGGPTRAEVEDRLGPPAHVYEGGRVVTYAIDERDGRLTATAYAASGGYTLVIEYGADGKVARRALVRRVQGGT